MSRLKFRQFWIIILLTAILAALQSYKIFSQEAPAKNLNTPFFGQDPTALGQQYTQQQAEEQKKIDAMTGKTKSKDKGAGGQAVQPSPQNSPSPDSLPPNYSGQPMSPAPSSGSPAPSEAPKPSSPTPSGELNRGY